MRPSHIGAPIRKSRYEPSPGKRFSFSDEQTPPASVIEVGNSRFVVKSGDNHLIRELRTFSEMLREDPRAEVRFTNRLICCTGEGRLEPWGWQRQPNRAR